MFLFSEQFSTINSNFLQVSFIGINTSQSQTIGYLLLQSQTIGSSFLRQTIGTLYTKKNLLSSITQTYLSTRISSSTPVYTSSCRYF